MRVALGGAGPVPVRAVSVEAALEGAEPSPEALHDAAERVVDDIEPIGDHRGSAAYKRKMARVWVRRALTEVTAGPDTSDNGGAA